MLVGISQSRAGELPRDCGELGETLVVLFVAFGGLTIGWLGVASGCDGRRDEARRG
jgi:hypothetical protein